MALSARIFGVNSWSILVPAGADGRRHRRRCCSRRCKRWYGPAAGLIAGAVLALTPVAVLMFRFNNPDALLVLLMVAGGVRDRRGRSRTARRSGWSGPACSSASASSPRCCRRCWWCPALRAGVPVRRPAAARQADRAAAARRRSRWSSRPAGTSRSSSCVPASMRPVHRRLAEQQHARTDPRLQRPRPAHRRRDRQRRRWRRTAAAGARPAWLRMFDSEQGGQISWLLPAALILLVGGLVLTCAAAAHRPAAGRR